MTILALETSCDDTCAAVVEDDGTIRSNVISSQRAHDRFGGVVPEIASRHHLELVNVVVDQALAEAGAGLDDVHTVAATQGPGLVGALLVGFSTAKSLAAARSIPFAAVDHLQGHVAANFLFSAVGERRSSLPFSASSPQAATRCSPTSLITMASTRSVARSTTPPARRSTRVPACSGSAFRVAPHSHDWPPRAIPMRSSSRRRGPARAAAVAPPPRSLARLTSPLPA